MANILLIDDNAIVAKAMSGILTRAGHRLVCASDAEAASKLLIELVKVDLIFSETHLKGKNGLAFLADLRAAPLLKDIPVVFVSSNADQTVVRKALSMRVQNFLIKPFRDADIYSEIVKAGVNPWRNLQFEAEKSFCTQMGFSPATLKKMREKVIEEIERLLIILPEANNELTQTMIKEKVDLILGDAEASGIWGLVDLMNDINGKVEINEWKVLPEYLGKLTFAKKLIFYQINPEQLPLGFVTEEERKAMDDAAEHSRWMDWDPIKNGPLVTAANIQAKLSIIKNCPVIDSVAASFTIFANGQAVNLANIAEVVVKDPGLTAEILAAVNRLDIEDKTSIDDPRVAISLLGELRMQALARNLLMIEERSFQAPPFNWPHFWLFQTAVAHIARYACTQMELNNLTPIAFNAGLLHDLGKSITAHLFPYAIPAIVQHARAHSISLREAAKRFMEMSFSEIAAEWALNSGLPPLFGDVVRWVEHPEQATSNKEAVALVALARHLCMENHIGNNGEPAQHELPPLVETPAWKILRETVFPSFNIATFEAQAHVAIHGLRIELLGKMRLSAEETADLQIHNPPRTASAGAHAPGASA